MITALWNRLSSTRLCFWILNLLTINLVIGGLYAEFDDRYRQLNMELFPHWLKNNFDADCWWLFSLIVLLLLLGINIFTCSSQRLAQLWQNHNCNNWQNSLLLLCPTLMHLCFLIILSGHALTELTGLKTMMIAKTGQHLLVDHTLVQVVEQHNSYRHNGPLSGKLQQCEAQLKFTRAGHSHSSQLQILKPLRYAEFTYHLVLDSNHLPGQPPHLLIAVKQDPGRPLILLGNMLMVLLLCGYFLKIRKQHNGDHL